MIRTMDARDIPRQRGGERSPLREWCGAALEEFAASGAEACELLDPPAPYARVQSAMASELHARGLRSRVRLVKRGDRMFLRAEEGGRR